jgi:diguanylate cyclase (GGDEF)-like protein/PAS domain S-box-containing protein
VALVCLGATLIIGGISLGVFPDESEFAEQARRQRHHGIAITAASLLRDQQQDDLKRVLQLVVDQRDDLVKIEIANGEDYLHVEDSRIFAAGNIANRANRRARLHDLPRSVRLKIDGADYGTAYFYHRLRPAQTWRSWGQLPMIRLLAFFVIAGIGVYTVFGIRMMQSFELTQIVPDRVRQALDTLPDGLLVMDAHERIILVNQSFSRTIGIDQQSLIGIRAGSLPWVCSPVTTVHDYPWVRAIRESKPQTDQLMRYELRNGKCLVFSINSSPFKSPKSSFRGVLATFRDVTETEQQHAIREQALAMMRYSRDEISTKNRELEILAKQDALTGCMNRRSFTEVFESKWKNARKQGKPISCLMIDNDRFKNVNDRYGHHVGDKVLRKISQVLKDKFPHPAMVCRYGGEEFCVCLPNTTLEEAHEKADRARVAIESIRFGDPNQLRVTVSIGGSETRFGASDVAELINQADKALYVAKGNGRNKAVVFGDGMFAASVESVIIRDHPGMTAADGAELPFQAVTALVSALAYRDAETAAHSRRVAELCVRLASGMLDERETHMLEIAGLLHDIGKIGVPDNVLLKPGPLTEDEWKLMRKHDRIGVDIATSTFNCEELSELIRTHHSFFEGSEVNPKLPTGSDIQLAARLLSIADAYDAMTSDRVYRKARSHEEAIEELRHWAGKQFDPELVEYFAEVITDTATSSEMDSVDRLLKKVDSQICELEKALEAQDADGLQSIAAKVAAVAKHYHVDAVVNACEQIEAAASTEDVQWANVLRDTNRLLNICKASREIRNDKPAGDQPSQVNDQPAQTNDQPAQANDQPTQANDQPASTDQPAPDDQPAPADS